VTASSAALAAVPFRRESDSMSFVSMCSN